MLLSSEKKSTRSEEVERPELRRAWTREEGSRFGEVAERREVRRGAINAAVGGEMVGLSSGCGIEKVDASTLGGGKRLYEDEGYEAGIEGTKKLEPKSVPGVKRRESLARSGNGLGLKCLVAASSSPLTRLREVEDGDAAVVSSLYGLRWLGFLCCDGAADEVEELVDFECFLRFTGGGNSRLVSSSSLAFESFGLVRGKRSGPRKVVHSRPRRSLRLTVAPRSLAISVSSNRRRQRSTTVKLKGLGAPVKSSLAALMSAWRR